MEIAAKPQSNPIRRVLGIRNFRLLFIGQVTSLLGDQFHGVAGAWLALKLTGDPLALGAILALAGLVRGVFTLLGGAISDRVSPRRLMLLSDILRLLLSGLLAAQVLTGSLQVWMLYIYSIVGGALGGLFGPAAMSITPRLVPEEDLQAGNSVMQGSTQLIGFVGPAAAGALVAAFKDPSAGAGAAIAFDALTFIASVFTLWLMGAGAAVSAPAAPGEKPGVLASVRAGIAYVFHDPALRLMFVLIAVANMAFGGPIGVGIPFLADRRFPEGAAAFGLIVSGYAGGNLLGILFSGALPRPSQKATQALLVVMFAIFGLGLAAMGWIPYTWVAVGDLFVLGTLNGYLSILLITSLQRNTPREMLGRLMSMVLLANMALMPLSQGIAGSVLRWNVEALFAANGVLLLLCALYLAVPKVSALLSLEIVGKTQE